MPESLAIAHVTLTVSNLSRTIPWYQELLQVKMIWDDTRPISPCGLDRGKHNPCRLSRVPRTG